MAFPTANAVTVVGNTTKDGELRFTPSGIAVCNLSVAWNQSGKKQADGSYGEDIPHYFDVTCWGDLAEHVAESIPKGTRVVVTGRLDQRSWETDAGEKRSKVEIVAESVAPDLRFATCELTKVERSQ